MKSADAGRGTTVGSTDRIEKYGWSKVGKGMVLLLGSVIAVSILGQIDLGWSRVTMATMIAISGTIALQQIFIGVAAIILKKRIARQLDRRQAKGQFS